MATILLVEDSVRWCRDILADFAKLDAWSDDETVFHVAHTIADAEALWFKHGADVDAVLMDACVPGDEPNTQGLVRRIRREEFTGPIICISSLREYGEMLIAAGCDTYCPKGSPALPTRVYELLTPSTAP